MVTKYNCCIHFLTQYNGPSTIVLRDFYKAPCILSNDDTTKMYKTKNTVFRKEYNP